MPHLGIRVTLLAFITGLLTVITLSTATAPSQAAPCSGNERKLVYQKDPVRVIKTYRGTSLYNGTEDNMRRWRKVKVTTEFSLRAFAEGEISASGKLWKIAKAGAEVRFGSDLEFRVAKNTVLRDTMLIRPGYSGWYQAEIKRQRIVALVKQARRPDCNYVFTGDKFIFDPVGVGEAGLTKPGRVTWRQAG